MSAWGCSCASAGTCKCPGLRVGDVPQRLKPRRWEQFDKDAGICIGHSLDTPELGARIETQLALEAQEYATKQWWKNRLRAAYCGPRARMHLRVLFMELSGVAALLLAAMLWSFAAIDALMLGAICLAIARAMLVLMLLWFVWVLVSLAEVLV